MSYTDKKFAEWLGVIFDDSKELREALSAQAKIEREERRLEREKQEQEIRDIIENGTTFSVEKYYLKQTEEHSLYDECELPDFDWAVKMFEQYRSIGHSIRLRKIVLSIDGKKFKGVNFKYNAPELNDM